MHRTAVADGAGDEAGLHFRHGLREGGLDGVGVAGFRVQVRQGVIAFAEGLAGDDPDVGLVIQVRGLPGRQEDVRIVREDEDGVRIDRVESPEEALHGGIHRLAALDDHVGPELLESVGQAGSGSDGDHAEGLPAPPEPFLHVVLVVLQGHVLHLDGQELAVQLAVVQDFAGGAGVDMDLDDGAVAEEDEGFPVLREPVGKDRFVEGLQVHLGALQPQEELRAVAEFQDAVLRKGVEVHFLDGRRVDNRHFGRLPVQGGAHPLRDIQESGPAAVHDPRLLQHVQEFRRVLERQVHRADEKVEVFVQVPASGRCFHGFPENGEDGSFHGFGNGMVGFFHTGLHGAGEGLDTGLPLPGKALGDTGEDAGQDDPGVAPGPREHAVRDGLGHLADPGS